MKSTNNRLLNIAVVLLGATLLAGCTREIPEHEMYMPARFINAGLHLCAHEGGLRSVTSTYDESLNKFHIEALCGNERRFDAYAEPQLTDVTDAIVQVTQTTADRLAGP
jgi:hypothetical protein